MWKKINTTKSSLPVGVEAGLPSKRKESKKITRATMPKSSTRIHYERGNREGTTNKLQTVVHNTKDMKTNNSTRT